MALIAVIGIVCLFLLIRYLFLRLMRYTSHMPIIDARIETHLSSLNYFNALSETGKALFIKRVRGIATTKRFVGMEGLRVTAEMRNRLSATLVQLTYGLPDTEIRSFGKVLIYPDAIYNPATMVKMKGFTSPLSDALAVSWPDFVEGFAIPDDNYNLGLHELAHALHINAVKVKNKADFLESFKFWTVNSLRDYYDLRENRVTFFREYGGTNFDEFFAVVIEHFFESPKDFLEVMPKLYIRTCALLNQNPLNKNNDYKYDREDFPAKKLRRNDSVDVD